MLFRLPPEPHVPPTAPHLPHDRLRPTYHTNQLHPNCHMTHYAPTITPTPNTILLHLNPKPNNIHPALSPTRLPATHKVAEILGWRHSKHYTLHPTPYTLHPTPYALHPTPQTLQPAPCTLNPQSSTLNTTPSTLSPTQSRQGRASSGVASTLPPRNSRGAPLYQQEHPDGSAPPSTQFPFCVVQSVRCRCHS